MLESLVSATVTEPRSDETTRRFGLPPGLDGLALASGLLREGTQRLARLRRVRGAHRRTEREKARAARTVVLASVLMGVSLSGAATAEAAPSFDSSPVAPFGLVGVGGHSTPTFADIDGDGDLDLFVGEYTGNTIFFENTGTAMAPAFGSSSANPFGLANVGSLSSPEFADIDGDGDLDAFVGGQDGNTIFFENTGTAMAPAFGSSSANPFGLVDVGTYSRPAFADIDGDGDLDLFVGSSTGNTIFFANTGTTIAPAFASSSANPFGLADAGSFVSPAFADIDGDGDLDAFVGNSSGDTIFFANTGEAMAPAFGSSSENPFGLVEVGSLGTPAFADIDADGDLDAFVGESEGSTLIFENTGAATAPAFDSSLLAPFGLVDVGTFSNPAFADIDGDGDLDAVVGNYFGSMIYFENTGTATAPAFGSASVNPFGLVDVGFLGAPTFADIDGDGDLDAFVGERYGNTIFLENTGTATAPAFGSSSSNPFGLADVGGRSGPTFADLDGDGDLDAFVGNTAGNTVFFENTGTDTAPAFGPSSENPFGFSGVGKYSSPAFADLDGDGDLDAIVGESTGNMIFFENSGTATAPAFGSSSANPFGLVDVGGSSSPAFADIDGDGDLDAFVGEYSGRLFFFRNTEISTVPPGETTVGLHDPVNGAFFLRNTHANGPANETFFFGPAGAGWTPIAGDWDGNPTVTVGLFDPVNGAFFLRNAHANGPANETFFFGPANAGWIPIAGDWDGNGTDTVGLFDPVNGAFFLRNAHANGPANETFFFGPANAGWIPIAGDWDANGTFTVGLHDPANGAFFLRNAHANGPANETFFFGPANAGWTPIAGDWDAQ